MMKIGEGRWVGGGAVRGGREGRGSEIFGLGVILYFIYMG
jgi:hypothetical protein